jgi:hypothetical protein
MRWKQAEGILRLKWRLQRSHRETARSLGISAGAVASVIGRARGIGLTWDALEGLTDEALEQRLYGPKMSGRVTALDIATDSELLY